MRRSPALVQAAFRSRLRKFSQENKCRPPASRLAAPSIAAAFAAALGCAHAEEAAERMAERAPPHRQCFSTAQTREKIEAHRLTDPFACMRAAAHELGGEALGRDSADG